MNIREVSSASRLHINPRATETQGNLAPARNSLGNAAAKLFDFISTKSSPGFSIQRAVKPPSIEKINRLNQDLAQINKSASTIQKAFRQYLPSSYPKFSSNTIDFSKMPQLTVAAENVEGMKGSWGGRKFEIDFKNAIGSGANSKVYTGKLDDKPVAIKVGLMSELLILPQLIKAQESGAKILFPLPLRISDDTSIGDIGVMPLMDTSLKQLKENGGSTDIDLDAITQSISETISLLDRHGINHGDIHDGNILVKLTHGQAPVAYLSDFGSSSIKSPTT